MSTHFTRTFTLQMVVKGHSTLQELERENVVTILAYSTAREAIEEAIMSVHGACEVTFHVSDLIQDEWPSERSWFARTIPVPFDTDEYPKAVLVQGDDVATSTCGRCFLPAEEWLHDKRFTPGGARPGVMYKAELLCARCCPFAYDEHTGQRVNAYNGYSLGGYSLSEAGTDDRAKLGPAGSIYYQQQEEEGLS